MKTQERENTRRRRNFVPVSNIDTVRRKDEILKEEGHWR